jgi:peptide/nickel transport system permease protein
MFRYIVKRLLLLIPVIVGAALIDYFILSLTKEDPVSIIIGDTEDHQVAAQMMREELGLDKPLIVQFANYMGGLVRGDLGKSYKTGEPVFQEYLKRFPATIKLALGSMAVAILIALPIGIFSAVRQYSKFDNIGMTVALLGVATPNFWLGLI